MITCHLRYEIDPAQVAVFEEYVCGWIPIVGRLGGTHHGCFLPHEGANDIAYAMFSFPSLAAYERYRSEIREDPEAQQLWELARTTACVRRFQRTFLRPVLP
ncbi:MULTISPECIES: NIPSNAP family protein [Streptomyces]|uniref:NIPSNAP family protein n=1 Tax=Streptomyces TaxID=1883 RepID=UPI000CF27FDC|nr:MULTISPECIES: NIPSNAP family protein [Streptomyces]PPS70180.1 NIPSNAP family protein [Streptomyces sp. 46]